MEEYQKYLEQLKNNPPSFVINMVAAPNGGKGTQCAILSRCLEIPTISVGDLIRAEQAKGTALGKEFNYYTENRLVAPAALTLQVLAQRLVKEDCKKGFILEGYPRTQDNADAIKEYIKFSLVIEMRVPESVLYKRMQNRGRSDDKKDKQKVGLEIYKNQTLPVAKSLVSGNRYFVIDEDTTDYNLVQESGLVVAPALKYFFGQDKEDIVEGFASEEFALENFSGDFKNKTREQKEAIYRNVFDKTKFEDYGQTVADALSIDLNNENIPAPDVIRFINARHINLKILNLVDLYKIQTEGIIAQEASV